MGAGVAALAALGEADRAKDWMRRALLIDPDNLHDALQLRLRARGLAGRPRGGARHAGAGPGAGHRLAGEGAATDPDLAGLRDDPRFQAMVAAAEARLAAGEAEPPPA